MKKIYLGVIGLVSVVFLFVWCNDSGIEKADGVAEDFINSFIEKATNVGGGDNNGGDNGGGGNNTPICGNWSVTTPASCTAFGVETRTCTKNGSSYTETQNIPKLTTGCNTGGGGNSYTITFNANNGTVSQTVTTGTDGRLTSLPTPTKDGYNFNGWYTATSGGTKITTSTVFSGNDTIYAQWTAVSSGGNDSYESVTIGEKKWMKKNLNIEIADSWCYENSVDSCAKYGRLYTWEAAKKACPNGWRLPTNDDWGALVTAAGGWQIAGKALKSQSGWNDYIGKSGNGTDDHGFSALPGGGHGSGGGFYGTGLYGNWWTATEGSGGLAYRRDMDYGNDYVYEHYDNKSNGFSVRCVKNN
jgi:uncharacterized protein (TIGR02145 family)/uncharacterized repeat protein (TIGR02543 family)